MTLPYSGPTALAYSRYANPSMRGAQLATVPPTVSSTNTTANSTIATKGQIAASHEESTIDKAAQDSDMQLAVAQGNALKEEVEKHTARFSKTVSSTVTNTRRLLGFIREAVQKEDALALESVEDLWVELEQLFKAAQGTKEALPVFLERQRNNMALYHASVVNETYRESQDELNMQAKKVNLQHSLILEHQQAFQDYKAKTTNKLKELEDLHERVSRLTLEKGNFRGEIDKYARLLEQEQVTKAEDLKKADALQKELEALASSKMQLLGEIEGLQKFINDLQDKSQAAEQQLTDRFKAEIKEKAGLLENEAAKTVTLTSLINTLKEHESSVKMENEKVKAESKLLNEKYSRMAAEHSQAFSKSKEQNKRVETLTTDIERFRQESVETKQRLERLPELEKRNAELFREKASLLEQIGEITIERNQVQESCVKVNKELATLTDKLEKVQQDSDTLKVEKSNLLLQYADLQKENYRSIQAIQKTTKLEIDNADLRATVDELKATQNTPAVGEVRSTNKEKAMLDENMTALQEQNVKLQGALDEWMSLAKRSYKEYKDMLPTYKQAEQIRTSAEKKDEMIKGLELELSAAKSYQSNGLGAGGDATYWKKKYDGLLSSIGN